MQIRRLAVGVGLIALSVYACFKWIAEGSVTSAGVDKPLRRPSQQGFPPNERPLAFFDSIGARGPSTPVALQEASTATWRAMAAKYANAQSMRAFYYEAIKRPQDGGYFYSTRALGACKYIDPSRDAASMSTRRQHAVDSLRARCDVTEQDREDAYRQLAGTRDLNLAEDPLLGQVFDYLRAQNDEAKARILHTAIDTGSPELIAALLTEKVETSVSQALGGDVESTKEYVSFTSQLIECHLGADCGDTSISTLALCVRYDWCEDDLPAALRKGLGNKFDRLNQVAMQMVKNVQKRNLAGLLSGN